MDPELRAYLDAMEQRTIAKMEAMEHRIGAKIDTVDAKAGASRAVAEAALQAATAAQQAAAAAGQTAEAARHEARVMHAATLDAIRALGEGLTKHQSEQIDRQAAEQHNALMDQHIRPLEASVAKHEHRITALEHETR